MAWSGFDGYDVPFKELQGFGGLFGSVEVDVSSATVLIG